MKPKKIHWFVVPPFRGDGLEYIACGIEKTTTTETTTNPREVTCKNCIQAFGR